MGFVGCGWVRAWSVLMVYPGGCGRGSPGGTGGTQQGPMLLLPLLLPPILLVVLSKLANYRQKRSAQAVLFIVDACNAYDVWMC